MKKYWLLRRCKKVIRVLLSCGAALLIAVIVLQNDAWLVRRYEESIISLMESFYGCKFSAKVAALHPLLGSVVLKDVRAGNNEHDDEWLWSATSLELSWSWKDLLWGKKCAVTCTLHDFVGRSAVVKAPDGFTFAIAPHVTLLCAPAQIDIPFDIAGLSIRNGYITLYEQGNKDSAYTVQASVTGELGIGAEGIKAVLAVDHAKALKGTAPLIENIWLKSVITQTSYSVEGRMVSSAVPAAMESIKFVGQGTFDAGNCTLATDNNDYTCTINVSKAKGISGTWTYVIAGLRNTAHWSYSPQTGLFESSWRDMTLPSPLQDLFENCAVVFHNNNLTFQANGKHHSCTLGAQISPTGDSPCMIQTLDYIYEGNPIIACKGNEKGFSGILSPITLHRLANKVGWDFQGEGVCSYRGWLYNSAVSLNIGMDNAHIRIPHTYSVIQRLRADVVGDMKARSCVVKDAQIDLYKGDISCSRAAIFFDDYGAMIGWHVPLLVRKCFFEWKKELFAQISGACTFTYNSKNTKNEQPNMRCQGLVVVDQAHIRGNVLSSEFQSDFFDTLLGSFSTSGGSSVREVSHDCVCDVSYTTRSPLEIKTPFLEGAVVCEGHIGGSITDPYITGSVSFVRGTLAFPYKPLFITKGVVTMRTEALDDPFIELVARGRIKKYDIDLTVTGSLRNPQISFSSSPFLEQAHIITLLLGGSEDGSLYFLMPKVITDTLENLLFGPAHSTSRVQKYLKNLVRPFKGVTITPRLSDQEGRGGVRGALSFEVNDRLRATIAKNVSLPEDTTFEVEYDISDDASFRAMRDERGDLGLEGEVRWKF